MPERDRLSDLERRLSELAAVTRVALPAAGHQTATGPQSPQRARVAFRFGHSGAAARALHTSGAGLPDRSVQFLEWRVGRMRGRDPASEHRLRTIMPSQMGFGRTVLVGQTWGTSGLD
jgi:hypothetical protein